MLKQLPTIPSTRTEQARELALQCIDIMDALDRFRPEIEEAMRQGTHTHDFDDVVDMVVNGEGTLRTFGDDAFAIINVVNWPKARHYHIFCAGGNMQTLMDAIPEMEAEALQVGCDRVTINGRPGWARQLRKIGARHAYTMLAIEVPLSHG